ncbi:hypothetical protein Astex_3846 (plasmid) [Asticcacaulis excentricus CB 48]|uniref:Transcriptional regulator TetR C-terminal Firmicutes type domain-containing protein n=1 Tax=Asticcacaulis excentricus (strain ATCC 15261 / DSM 4724 / KCTC 12464 / NCIMB 9791 / VKM B-1370 / CB 48) TaxID=573065 RepID=E8RW32_ASTEC|nr:hypothetical protein Astex_3846 [Asticcacaulis excentricus CB 48]
MNQIGSGITWVEGYRVEDANGPRAHASPARRHLPAYRALIGNDGLSVSLGSIKEILADLVRVDLKGRGQTDRRETTVAFVVGAFMAVMTQWLDGGAKAVPAEIDAHFRRLIENGVG